MKIFDYQIIECETPFRLEQRVKEEMKGGWQPLGGVATRALSNPIYLEGKIHYSQAMVKYEGKPYSPSF